MKKYLIKITALSVAALMSVCALASCGNKTDESTAPETETTETIESTDKQEPEAETEIQTENTEK